jgi:dTDP-4-amino-4,6-dideoxygalactose transaminase
MAKHLTTQAKVPHAWEFVHDHVGYNYRMPNLNAAMACAQLEQLDSFIANKRATSLSYQKHFEKEGINFFTEPNQAFSNYWLNAVILKSQDERDVFLKETNDAKIMTRPAWRLMHKLSMFSDCITSDVSNAEYIEEKLVNIPSSVIIN